MAEAGNEQYQHKVRALSIFLNRVISFWSYLGVFNEYRESNAETSLWGSIEY